MIFCVFWYFVYVCCRYFWGCRFFVLVIWEENMGFLLKWFFWIFVVIIVVGVGFLFYFIILGFDFVEKF